MWIRGVEGDELMVELLFGIFFDGKEERAFLDSRIIWKPTL